VVDLNRYPHLPRCDTRGKKGGGKEDRWDENPALLSPPRRKKSSAATRWIFLRPHRRLCRTAQSQMQEGGGKRKRKKLRVGLCQSDFTVPRKSGREDAESCEAYRAKEGREKKGREGGRGIPCAGQSVSAKYSTDLVPKEGFKKFNKEPGPSFYPELPPPPKGGHRKRGGKKKRCRRSSFIGCCAMRYSC